MTTHLALTLNGLMQKNQVTGKEITRQSIAFGRHIPSSWISRITTGTQTWIAHQQLEILARCVSASSQDHAELVKAHLLDERPPFAARLVSVTTQKDTGASAPDLSQTNPATRAAIEFLLNRPETHHLLIGLATAIGMNKAK